MAVYAVGDIQGCYKPLRKLLDKINFDPAIDRLWCVGDLVNRGPDSLRTLRFLKELGPAFTSVLGNHDLHFLALATGAHDAGKKKTLKKLLNAYDCDELCEWVRYLPIIHHESLKTNRGKEAFLMVHAGFAPGWSLEQIVGYASEIESVLRGEKYQKFLSKMYGDQPDIWHEKLDGMKRLRVLTNYFTRIRFCNPEAKLNLAVKTGANTAPKGYKPWYQFQKINKDLSILFGHWATLNGVTDMKNVYALDTGCVWGRCLTALRLEDKQIFCTECN
jgi:bis(5'-nucleosyl)-tetraphosphatase (symmetrical)